MKIIITGSLGNISRPLAEDLVRKGHAVTVVSSNAGKRKDIEGLGARAAIGSIEDAGFLTETFAGAEAVYCMIPMSFTEPDQAVYMLRVAQNYRQALENNKIGRVVVLSGWTADLIGEENVEQVLNDLPDASITILRPGYFYSNFYTSMEMIKGTGILGKFLTLRYSGLTALLKGQTGILLGNFGGDDRIIFVSPKDIAGAAAEELTAVEPPKMKIRYVGSEEMTCSEAAQIIGTAVGKPYLKWVLISDKEMRRALKMAKLPANLAEMLVKMQATMHSGAALQKFHQNNPPMGRVKLKDFAEEFAADYHQKGS